ncbi:MAG: tetratricopeptide repeat protein [Minwuia sp.]|nr:tetratricopeptide repeat protein [Minwuia sp.]
MAGPATDHDLETLLTLLQQGKTDEVSRRARRGLKRAPGDAGLLFAAGLAEHASGHVLKGITKLRRAARAAPDAVAIALNLGIMLAEKGDNREAIGHLARASRLQPDDPTTLAHLGHCQLRAGDIGSARASLDQALTLSGGGDANLLRLCGMACRLDGDLAAAISHFERAVASNSRDGEAAVELGITRSMSGDLAGAERAYRQAVSAQPTNARAYRQLGNLLTRTGRFEAAVSINRQALNLSPGDLSVMYDLAHAMASSDRPDQALDLLDPLINAGKAPIDLEELAAFASFRKGDPAACIARSDRILLREPGRTAAIAYKAMAFNELGNRAAAAEILALERLVSWEIVAPPPDHATIDDFNARLIAEIEGHPSLAYSALNRSLTSGRSTGELFDAPSGAIAEFKGWSIWRWSAGVNELPSILPIRGSPRDPDEHVRAVGRTSWIRVDFMMSTFIRLAG